MFTCMCIRVQWVDLFHNVVQRICRKDLVSRIWLRVTGVVRPLCPGLGCAYLRHIANPSQACPTLAPCRARHTRVSLRVLVDK